MDFRELQYIITIANEGSISRAAEKLYIAQPTLSRFLQNHEKLLDVTLFQRINGKMLPTYAGERYLDYARQIIHIGGQMNQELVDISSQRKGRLNIACPRHRRDGIFLLSLLRFKSEYPGVEVNVLEEASGLRISRLLNGEVDLAILYPIPYHPTLFYEPLIQEEVVFCTPPHHPLAIDTETYANSKYPWIDIRKFADQPFILQPENSLGGSIAHKVFQATGIKPNIALRTVDLSGTIEAVSKGYGCAFIPDSFIRFVSISPSPKLFSIGGTSTKVMLSVAYNTMAYRSKCMTDFIRILKETIREKYQ